MSSGFSLTDMSNAMRGTPRDVRVGMHPAEIVAAARRAADYDPIEPLTVAAIEANIWACIMRPLPEKMPLQLFMIAIWATHDCAKGAIEALTALSPDDPIEPDLSHYTEIARKRALWFQEFLAGQRRQAEQRERWA